MAGALYLLVSRRSLEILRLRSDGGAECAIVAEIAGRPGAAGICEEALFRGAIFGLLQRKSTAKAIIISAALFAVYHLNPWNLVPLFFIGVLFGLLRARSGSLVPGMVAHAPSTPPRSLPATLPKGRLMKDSRRRPSS